MALVSLVLCCWMVGGCWIIPEQCEFVFYSHNAATAGNSCRSTAIPTETLPKFASLLIYLFFNSTISSTQFEEHKSGWGASGRWFTRRMHKRCPAPPPNSPRTTFSSSSIHFGSPSSASTHSRRCTFRTDTVIESLEILPLIQSNGIRWADDKDSVWSLTGCLEALPSPMLSPNADRQPGWDPGD